MKKILVFFGGVFLPIFFVGMFFATDAYAYPFLPKVDYPTGLTPFAITSGDFNKDGAPDVAVVNQDAANISVYIGNGDGTFGSKADYITGFTPNFIITADFNEDTYPDLAVVNENTTISVYIGNGDGTFASQVEYDYQSAASFAVQAGDFNNDEHLDLVVPAKNGQQATFFWGVGDGTFGTPTHISVGSRNPVAIAVADFDGDENLDFVTANETQDTISVFLGNGDGTFAFGVDYATGELPTPVITADFDEDGNVDVAVGNSSSSTVSVFLGNGDGTFASKVDYPSGNILFFLTTADLNNDGYLDTVTANNDSTVSVLLGNGDGTFEPKVDFMSGNNNLDVTIADFNQDGDLDLATPANTGSGFMSILLSGSATIVTPAISGVTIPVVDGTHVSDIPETIQYTATVSWDPSDSPFLLGAVYTATITITPKYPYTLTGVPQNFFTVNGAVATNDADSGIITAVFPVTTLSTGIVNSLFDDGDGTCTEVKCTFRDAINTSQDGDTISFGNISGAIMLTLDEPITIDHALTIIGPGSDDLTIDFNNGDNEYIRHTNGDLMISGLTITHGDRPIWEQGVGTLDMSDVVIINNSGHAALFIDESAGITISDSQFIDNTNTLEDECCGGGAIFIDDIVADVVISNINFSGNTASGSYGGAIHSLGQGALALTNVTFVNNSADYGGGIYAEGANIAITNATFSNNTAVQEGGTLYASAGDITVINSLFSGTDSCYVGNGTITSLGHNIDSDGSCGFVAPGDQSTIIPTYTNLHDFDGDGGSNPYGSLLEIGGVLYGLTQMGGENSDGVIFSFDPDTSTYTNLHDFDGTDGGNPGGSFIESGGILYGLAANGGANNDGVIFSFDPDTSTYTNLHDFDEVEGKGPYTTLVASNGILYGVASSGGLNGYGVIFSYDPDTDTYINLHDFDETDGGNPYGSLIISGNKLYGASYNGGLNGYGVIFSYDPDTDTYTNLYDFGGTDGSSQYGSLLEIGGVLYGLTQMGGENSDGVIFSFDPDTSTYTNLHDFDGTDGGGAYSFIENNGVFYGMTEQGGANNDGVIFSFDPDTSTYTNLHDFDGTDGGNPGGSFIESGGILYGLAANGGANNDGVIFSYSVNDAVSVDPLLDPAGLADNGGPIPTIALLEGSPAINTGNDDAAPETDARGFVRVGVSDVGAYEYRTEEEQDSTAPSTTLAPLGSFPTTDASSTFTFESNESGTFECSLDSSSFVSCTSPYTTPTLSVGSHTLSVRAIDASNNVDASPATFTWVVIRRSSGGGGGGSSIPSVTCTEGEIYSPFTGKRCALFTPRTPATHLPLPLSSKYHFTRNLSIKMIGEDVRQLQIYLNTHGYPVAPSGVGSRGYETNYFGLATRAALIKFQIANNIKPSVGFFGPVTRGWVEAHQ